MYVHVSNESDLCLMHMSADKNCIGLGGMMDMVFWNAHYIFINDFDFSSCACRRI